MSVSTDAVIFYGYCWDEETTLLELEEGQDWENFIAAKRGLVNPWSSYQEPPQDMRWQDREEHGKAFGAANRAAIDAYYAAKTKIITDLGCEINSHCSDGFPIPYISIQGSGKLASRGYPQKLTGADLHIDPKWDGLLKAFCTELGIEPPEGQSPSWWLVSYWG